MTISPEHQLIGREPMQSLPARQNLTRRTSLGVLAAGLAAGLTRPGTASAALSPAPIPTWPERSWASLSSTAAGFDAKQLKKAISYASSRGGAGFVVRSGWKVAAWGNPNERYDVKSATKGFGGMLLGLALADGLVGLQDTALSHLPEFGVPPSSNNATGWLPLITLEQLVLHTAGFDEPGGFEPLLFQPGTYTYYDNCGPNWLADVLTVTFAADLWQVLRQRVLSTIGITDKDLTWRANMYRPSTLHGYQRREFGAGIHINAQAMARAGLLLMRQGYWQATQVLPTVYIDQAFHGRPEYTGLADYQSGETGELRHEWMYILDNDDGVCPDLPGDTFWFWGKYNNHLLVVPSLDLVVVRTATDTGSFGDTFASVNDLFRGFPSALGWVTTAPLAAHTRISRRPRY